MYTWPDLPAQRRPANAIRKRSAADVLAVADVRPSRTACTRSCNGVVGAFGRSTLDCRRMCDRARAGTAAALNSSATGRPAACSPAAMRSTEALAGNATDTRSESRDAALVASGDVRGSSVPSTEGDTVTPEVASDGAGESSAEPL